MPRTPRDKHAPNRFSRHRRIHRNRIQTYIDAGFVLYDGIDYKVEPGGHTLIDGKILCEDGIVITVEKQLEVVVDGGDPTVQTVAYAYNASVSGHGNFLRYDNLHDRPGHPDRHHRHQMDWRVAGDRGTVEWVGVSGWPTLSEFIDLVQSWHAEHVAELRNCGAAHPANTETKLNRV